MNVCEMRHDLFLQLKQKTYIKKQINTMILSNNYANNDFLLLKRKYVDCTHRIKEIKKNIALYTFENKSKL